MTHKKTYRVLFAEDDKYINRAFYDGQKRHGFNVETAFDGNEAIKKIKDFNPHIILLDLLIPVCDGYEVLSWLRKKDKLKNQPVIIFTNLDSREDVNKALKMGAADYLVKANFTMPGVIKVIEKYLS